MKALLKKIFEIVRLYNSRKKRNSVEQALKKRYVISIPKDIEQQWVLVYNLGCLINVLDYKDETWDQVINLNRNMLLHSFGIYNRAQRAFNSIRTKEGKKLRINPADNAINIKSQGLSNDWIYLTTHKKKFDNCRVSVKVRFNSIFKEFQIAFRHHSLLERLRFRIIDGSSVVFEIVTKGFFSEPIQQIPFAIEIGKIYDIDLVCVEGDYSFSIDKKVIMSIRDRLYRQQKGELAFVLWDDKPKSNIQAEIIDISIYEINTKQR